LLTASNPEMLRKKIDDAKKIVRDAFDKYEDDDLAIAWTGGKDSTLVLWLIREVCLEDKRKIPKCFNIDEGDMFDEVRSFIDKVGSEWGVDMTMLHNADVSNAAGGKLGATVKVNDLNERNQREVARLGYEEEEFPYEPESFVGNHLMKTVALNEFLQNTKVAGFFEGIRWDEQASRANETYFSPREATEYSPAHMRICPILHFTEREVWEVHFENEIPICSLYHRGYRSLGARVTTTKESEIPAWEQDLENTNERGGRRQDKEHLMEKLRQLGYM
jgi:phosphoadenosine phosphosulfate reductase